MGEKNHFFSALRLVENFNHQYNTLSKTNQLDLNLTLSMGGSSSSATRPPPESEVIVRTLFLNGKSDTSKNRAKAIKRLSDKKRGIRTPIQISEEGEEIVEMRDGNGRIGNWVIESATKNTALCRPLEKLKFINAPEGSNGANIASTYHFMANFMETQIEQSNYSQSGKSSYCPDKMPIIRGDNGISEQTTRVSSISDDVSNTSMMLLMNQMPQVMVTGPTGEKNCRYFI